MISQFDEFTDAADAVDEVFSEPVRLYPKQGGLPDPERETQDIFAVLRVGGAKDESLGSSRSWHSKIMEREAELSFSCARSPLPVLRKGDIVRALARDGRPCWEVLAEPERASTRLVYKLGETS